MLQNKTKGRPSDALRMKTVIIIITTPILLISIFHPYDLHPVIVVGVGVKVFYFCLILASLVHRRMFIVINSS